MKKNIFFYSLFFVLLFVGTSPVFAMKDMGDLHNFTNDPYLCELFEACQNDLTRSIKSTCSMKKQTPNKRTHIPANILSKTIQKFLQKQVQYLLLHGIDENIIEKFAGTTGFGHIRRLTLDEEKEYKTVIIGDIHADAYALGRILIRLQKMNLIDKNFKTTPRVRIVFTGDIADKGKYSILTWYLLMNFFLLNENSVAICRGNHEMTYIAKHFKLHLEFYKEYFPFEKPTTKNIGIALNSFNLLLSACCLLPTAIYMGNLQICHGGLPYVPTPTNENKRNSSTCGMLKNFDDYSCPWLSKLQEKATSEEECFVIPALEKIGLCNNDFHNDESKNKIFDNKRLYFHQSLIQSFFKNTKSGLNPPAKRYIILRGHSHNPHAVSYLGENCTEWMQLTPENPFCLSKQPHNVYTFMCNTRMELPYKEGFGIVTSKGHYDTWTLTAYEYEQTN